VTSLGDLIHLKSMETGMVHVTVIPATWEGGRDWEDHILGPAEQKVSKTSIPHLNKVNWVWWNMSTVSATWEL
jgi:hypothetical protein